MFTMDESTLPKIDDFDKDSNLDLNLIAMNVAVEAVGRPAAEAAFPVRPSGAGLLHTAVGVRDADPFDGRLPAQESCRPHALLHLARGHGWIHSAGKGKVISHTKGHEKQCCT